MTIAIDIRPLFEPRGGIREYTAEITAGLLSLRSDHSFVLFSSGMRKPDTSFFGGKDIPRATNVHLSIPNKVLNGLLAARGRPLIDEVIREKTGIACDVFFSPNINFLALSRRCKRITTLHDLSFETIPESLSQKSALWHLLVNPKAHYTASHAVIAVSEQSKRDAILVYGIQPEKVHPIHLACAHSFFSDAPLESRESYALPSSYFFALGGGARKNMLALIDAYALARRAAGGAPFPSLLLGGLDPRTESSYARSASAAGIERSVFFAGVIPAFYLRAYYRYARAFVYPSITEGFGIPPLEAAACGTPVVASAAGAIGEIMGSAALLVNPYRIEELARALSRMASDDTVWNEYRERGGAHVRQFSWERCAVETLRIMESV